MGDGDGDGDGNGTDGEFRGKNDDDDDHDHDHDRGRDHDQAEAALLFPFVCCCNFQFWLRYSERHGGFATATELIAGSLLKTATKHLEVPRRHAEHQPLRPEPKNTMRPSEAVRGCWEASPLAQDVRWQRFVLERSTSIKKCETVVGCGVSCLQNEVKKTKCCLGNFGDHQKKSQRPVSILESRKLRDFQAGPRFRRVKKKLRTTI